MDELTMKKLVKEAKKNKNKRKEKGGWIFKGIILAFLLIHAIVLFVLLYSSLNTSLRSWDHFKDNENFFAFPDFDFLNFGKVFAISIDSPMTGKPIDLIRILLNTLLYTVGCALFGTIVPCLVAYVVAKFKNVVSTILMSIVIVTMAIPIVGNTAAMLDVLQTLKLYNTIYGAWILRANFLGMYFLVFVAAFKSLPDSYMEAAYIDGASEWRVMLRVMFPLVKTIFSTIFILQFIDCWNDYNTPLLYIPDFPTLSYAVYYLSGDEAAARADLPVRIASSLVMVVPTVILFVIFKDKLMGNLSMGGVKG